MRILILFMFLLPTLAFAQPSVIEFTVPNDGGRGVDYTYRFVLHERDSKLDEIRRADMRGIWETIYVGTITSAELPADARLGQAYGPRALITSMLRHGDYKTNSAYSASLRVKSGQQLVVVTHFGAAAVPWPGQVLDVRQLDVDLDMYTGASILIFSVKGPTPSSSNTYMVVNDDFKNPYKILESFTADPLGATISEGIIHIESLHRSYDPKKIKEDVERMSAGSAAARERWKAEADAAIKKSLKNPYLAAHGGPPVTITIKSGAEIARGRDKLRNLFPAPGRSEIVEELIAQLNDREPLASMPQAEALVKQAVRALILREFPALLALSKEESSVRQSLVRAVDSISYLWLARRIQDGDTIRNVVIQRLEAAVDNRAKCDLALMSLSGQGSHAAGYYRGEALRALNALHARLYRR